MIKVRLAEDYQNWYWNSGTGVTIKKDNREGVMVNEDDPQIRLAIEQGFLELVCDEPKIISDMPDTKKTIKEVVTKENNKQIEKVKKTNKGEKDGL